MRNYGVSWTVALMSALLSALMMLVMPLAVMAQATPFDDESRATVVAVAQRVGATLVPGITAVAETDEEVPDADVVEDPEAPSPELEDPELEPEGEPVELPPLNLSDLAEYSSQGVTFQAPADWIVETDIADGTPFIIEVPGTDLFISMESDTGLTFPSWLAVALFRSQAELIIPEMGEDAELVESATIYTAQNLPMAKLSFTGTDAGEAIGGSLFVTAPNDDAYLVIAGGSLEEWAYAAPGIDLIAESVTFDDDLISVIFVEDEPLSFTDEDETVEVTVPTGWYATSTGDSQFPIIVAEEEVRFVAAVGNEEAFSGEFDPEILEFIPEEGDLAPEQYEELFASVMEMVENSGSPITVDEDLSSFVEREGAVTLRLVGNADLEEGLSMPIIFYIDLRRTGVGVVVIFGDTESAFAVEETIQEMLESVTGLTVAN